jgi:hypothetical protein
MASHNTTPFMRNPLKHSLPDKSMGIRIGCNVQMFSSIRNQPEGGKGSANRSQGQQQQGGGVSFDDMFSLMNWIKQTRK